MKHKKNRRELISMKKITIELAVSDDFKVNKSEIMELFGKKYDSNFWGIDSLKAVSYTHLTLPTKA